MKRTIVDIIVEMMQACGAYNIDRWTWIIKAVYDEERNNPKSVFAENDADLADPFNRVEVAFAWSAKDEAKRAYCKRRIALAVLAHRVYEHNGDEGKIDAFMGGEPIEYYPDIDAILSREQAETGSFWDIY